MKELSQYELNQVNGGIGLAGTTAIYLLGPGVALPLMIAGTIGVEVVKAAGSGLSLIAPPLLEASGYGIYYAAIGAAYCAEIAYQGIMALE
jgi:hypothetical protein